MNLHGVVSGAIGAVNPFLPATISISVGSITGADGSQTPEYTIYEGIPVQVQALTYKDLQQIAGLNLNGTRRAIYVSGELDATVRAKLKGGDLVTLAAGPSAGVWLVAQVLEQWPDWCKVAATLQNNS